MHSVVLALERICAEAQLKQMTRRPSSSGMVGAKLVSAAQTFVSRLEDLEARSKIEELKTVLQTRIGAEALDIVAGVYNGPRLHRFLLANKMDVQDATSAIVRNCAGRLEFEMDAKREEIGKRRSKCSFLSLSLSRNFTRLITPFPVVGSDLGFSTIPRAEEFRSFFPNNPFLARTKGGNVVRYFCIGKMANFAGFRAAFTPKDTADQLLYHEELSGMLLDALAAIEARNISYLTFFDCSYGQVNSMFSLMERELDS